MSYKVEHWAIYRFWEAIWRETFTLIKILPCDPNMALPRPFAKRLEIKHMQRFKIDHRFLFEKDIIWAWD